MFKYIFTSGESNEVSNYFSASQMKQILTSKRVKWSKEDIVKGLMVYSLSRRCYQLIRKKKMIPLPSPSTLKMWVSKFHCTPGILTDVMSILKKQMTSDQNIRFRLGVLVFDEMDLKKVFEYFPLMDCVFPAIKKVQVAMVRGLCADWKQPVFFNFDTPMKEDVSMPIIIDLENVGVEIWAMVCDAGSTNQALINRLQVSKDNTWFQNPADETRQIFAFFDPPHMLKLLRNHILDDGIAVDGDEAHLTRKEFEDILQRNSAEMKIHPKLTEFHINCTGSQRQRVRPAAQLLSHTSATAIRSKPNTSKPTSWTW